MEIWKLFSLKHCVLFLDDLDRFQHLQSDYYYDYKNANVPRLKSSLNIEQCIAANNEGEKQRNFSEYFR